MFEFNKVWLEITSLYIQRVLIWMSLATILVCVEPPARKEIPQWVAELIPSPVNDLGYQEGLFELNAMSYQKRGARQRKNGQ